jgi:predicted DCC family thiol-disulfide oxidoreductase YuxK
VVLSWGGVSYVNPGDIQQCLEGLSVIIAEVILLRYSRWKLGMLLNILPTMYRRVTHSSYVAQNVNSAWIGKVTSRTSPDTADLLHNIR